jgi:16S rRNA (adenine1518-N6/adenine1519-N6)-dimethyltransferase
MDNKKSSPNPFGIQSYASRGRRKALGQNFLRNSAVVRRIVESLGPLEQAWVLEIGAGPGQLTERLAVSAARITALELDRALAESLTQTMQDRPTVEVLHQDALRFDFRRWAEECGALRPVVVGNIPYSITSALLHTLLDSASGLGLVVLMLQEEAARKLTAQAGGKPYGMLSVLAAYRADLKYLFPVKREYFSPRPKVDSAVVRLDFGSPFPQRARDEKVFEAVVRRLFLERRKQVQKVLRSDPLYRLSAEDLEALAGQTGIDLSNRPERLSVGDFVALADYIALLRENAGG